MPKSLRQVLADHIRNAMAWTPDMTVTSLAKQAGISRGQLNNILTQNTDTKLDTIESIAKVFGTQPWILLMPPDQGDEDFRETAYKAATEGQGRMGDEHGKLAMDILYAAFTETDDEGRLALLRTAVSLIGWSPDLQGLKLPRDWRHMAQHWAHDAGWVELYPTGFVGENPDDADTD
jgi:transcriptional regulator with XRE-family HTH domain